MFRFLLFVILAAIVLGTLAILLFLNLAKKEIKNFMSAKTDELKAAITELKTAVADEMTQINAKLDELEHANDGDNDAIDAAIADIRETTAKVQGIVADEPEPMPEPEPEPMPEPEPEPMPEPEPEPGDDASAVV